MTMVEKVAIITGSSRGIGKAIALRFAEDGWRVVVNYHVNISAASDVVKEVHACGGQALLVKANVSKSADVERMVQKTLDHFHSVDVLVNNAGTATIRSAEELTEEEWDRDIAVNLKGVFLCSQSVGKVMIKQGRGNIINIASMLGQIALPRHVSYCASKAGVIALTKVLAIEWAKHNIRVNAIAPGFIFTEMVSDLVERGARSREEQTRLQNRIPLGRLGSPEDVANLVQFLVSEEAKYITGETVFIDGGWRAYGYL